MYKCRCITNNPMMSEQKFPLVEYHSMNVLELLRLTADRISDGYRLLSHPLTGSIRPDITPYKSILISEDAGVSSAEEGRLMEHAIEYTEELYRQRKVPLSELWPESTKQDFQLVDYSIIRQALEVAQYTLGSEDNTEERNEAHT